MVNNLQIRPTFKFKRDVYGHKLIFIQEKLKNTVKHKFSKLNIFLYRYSELDLRLEKIKIDLKWPWLTIPCIANITAWSMYFSKCRNNIMSKYN